MRSIPTSPMAKALVFLPLLVLILAGALAGLAAAAPPAGFDDRVEALLRASGAPGMGAVIVEGGKVALARGYGVRRLGAPERVDADTIFPIASAGKAFTTADLALLVDEGRLGWDDKVVDRLPGFQMYDPWVTREMTVRDLLVHRSGLGLGAGDLLFFPRSSLSRAEAVSRLRWIKPATSFRSGYAYDNVLYMAAGQLIEAVTGQTWERFTQERLLRPAGMTVSTADDADRFRTANRAQPHARLNGAVRGQGDQEVLDERQGSAESSAPAGGVSVSASDLGRWIQIQLGHGRLPEGGRLFSDAASREMWTPQTLIPIHRPPAAAAAAEPQFLTYALGWEVRDWRGHKIVWHDGGVDGYRAVVVLIPEKDVGFALMLNAEEGVVTRGLMYELLDHYLGFPAADWPAILGRIKAGQTAAAVAAVAATPPEVARRADAGPGLPPARYAGDYVDPWYGRMVVGKAGGGLTIDFKSTPGMVGDLEPWRYETFIARWRDKSIEPAFVTFFRGADGEVERVAMKAVSPQADFSYDYQDLDFRPVRPRP